MIDGLKVMKNRVLEYRNPIGPRSVWPKIQQPNSTFIIVCSSSSSYLTSVGEYSLVSISTEMDGPGGCHPI